MIYYIPGCDVNRNHPEAGKKAQKYMEDRNIAIGPCCKLDVSFLKADDTLITNCTQCDLIFAERVPGIRIMSLYEFVLEDPDHKWNNFEGEAMAVQDCFRTRNNHVLQDAVRRCLQNSNIQVMELKKNRGDTDFCGVWLNSPAAEDSVQAAPETFRNLEQYREILSEEEKKARMKAYVSELPSVKTAVYCNGCEKGLRLGSGNPLHLIEILFGN